MASTDYEKKVLAILGKCSSSLSIIGSSFIVLSVLSDKEKLKTTYHRILLSMSFNDVLASFAFFFSTWGIPKDTVGVYNPAGTQGTCTAQGFFIQTSLTSPLYNCVLCYYYMVVVCYNWQERVVRKAEIVCHIIAWGMGLITAFIGLGMNQYNHMGSWCWIMGSPPECEWMPDVPCERGVNARWYRLAMFTIPFWTATFVGHFAMCKVLSTVRAREGKASRLTSKQYRLTRVVAWQSFWYLIAYYCTWMPAAVQQLALFATGKDDFGRIVGLVATVPLQGAMNCVVYNRPNWIRFTKKNPQYSLKRKLLRCLKRLKKALFTSDDSSRPSQAGSSALSWSNSNFLAMNSVRRRELNNGFDPLQYGDGSAANDPSVAILRENSSIASTVETPETGETQQQELPDDDGDGGVVETSRPETAVSNNNNTGNNDDPVSSKSAAERTTLEPVDENRRVVDENPNCDPSVAILHQNNAVASEGGSTDTE